MYLEYPTHEIPFVKELSQIPFELRDGCFQVPDAPGLGVHLPPDMAGRYPFIPKTSFWA